MPRLIQNSTFLPGLLLLVIAAGFLPSPARAIVNTIPDSVNIIFVPPQPRIGEQVTVTISLKQPALGEGLGAGGSVDVCTPGRLFGENCEQAYILNGTGSSLTDNFAITNDFQPGQNTVQAKIIYQISEDAESGLDLAEYVGRTTLTVLAPSQGGYSLFLSETNTYPPNSTLIAKVFEIIYRDAPNLTSRTPSRYEIDCGGGDVVHSSPDDINFECRYANQTAGQTHQVVVKAFDRTGEIASKTHTVTITGTEQEGGIGPSQKAGVTSIFAGGIVSVVNIILGVVIGILRWVVWTLGSYVFVPVLDAMLGLRAGDIAGPVIAIGWTYLRDFVNMFFILILIMIGFGTILRIESYNYKQLLVKVIMMALLVNFSLVIGRIIIEIADIAQFTFLPAGEGISAVRNLFKNLSTVHIYSVGDGLRTMTTDINVAAAGTFTLIFQFILELGVVITFGALSIFMLIRTLALWILLIISPFAYALAILPSTESLAHKWWSNFIKYAFFAPIIAFFLRFTDVLYRNGLRIIPGAGATAEGQVDLVDKLNQLGQSDTAFSDSIQLVLVYVLIIGFLWAGLIITKQLGIAGADAIVGLAEKGMKAPLAGGAWVGKQLGGAAVRYGATKYDTATLGLASGNRLSKIAYGVLHPLKFRKAMKEDAEKDRERAKHLAETAALDIKRHTPGLKREGKNPMFHALMEQGEEELTERFGAYSGNESEEVKRTAKIEAAALAGDKAAARMIIAQTLRNAKGKHINQVLYEKGMAYNHANLSSYFNNLQEQKVFSSSINEELQTQLSETGYAIGDATLTELSDGGEPLEVEETELSGKATEKFWDPETGKMKDMSLKEYRYKGTKELLEARDEALTAPGVTDENSYEEKVRELYEKKVKDAAQAKGEVLDDHKLKERLENGRRALTNIRNRNINVSKVDKFNLFHNSLFTEKLVVNDKGKVVKEVVLGDGGDQAFLNIQAGDLWRASRNGIPDKSKEWLKKMLAQCTRPDDTVDAEKLRANLEDSYRTWLAARNAYKSDDEIKEEAAKKVEDFAKMAYASQFAVTVAEIEGAAKQSKIEGRTPDKMTQRAEYLLGYVVKGERAPAPEKTPR